MSLPPLLTTTLAIVINWVQRMGQILRHGKKGEGQKQAQLGNGQKKMPGAIILPLNVFWLRQRSPWMTCPVFFLGGGAT